ncbi:hypothetical protein C7S20_05085 [Christiangramia fulva]|uniref:Signal transduction histidine kinase internal region domain-containing protein n=1 Tax=Christiangramia fulva TaxID=2126553 RepID=A0A2R3Z375_9FLAO|nr:histidine kinase [Christiangramia fulva]AVR44688.1 hypothetical protein C7S20_05085 [Christiangramia fulva]
MTRKQEITYHIIFWILFIAMDQFSNYVLRDYHNPDLWRLIATLLFTTLEVTIFYTNYAWLAPRTIPQKNWAQFLGGIIALIFAFAGLRYFLEEIVLFQFTGMHNYTADSRNFLYYFYDNSYYALRILIISTVLYLIKKLVTTTGQLQELKIEKKQAQLQNLKSQLSPHFLFNTLNSMYSDLYDTSPKLSEDILKLSEMLRYVTYEDENDRVFLKDEIVFLKNYIDLFQRRFDNKLKITINFPHAVSNEQIPSLLLIHFVENAFKHGILDDPEKPLSILLKTEGNRLIMKTINFYKTQTSYEEVGIGYKNIRKRLDLMYGQDYKLNINNENGKFEAELKIPML